MDKFFEHIPEIISKASESTLSMVAFLVICLLTITYFLFAKDKPNVKVFIFILIFAGIGVLVFAFVRDDVIKFKPQPQYSNSPPKVIGIYPNDIFGVNQKKGLIHAIKSNSDDIEIIHLDFLSYEEMKSNSFHKLIDSLRYLLRNENVLAISGPSITECTDDVLKAIEQEQSNVPVFVSSAAPREFLKWDDFRNHIHLYRIGTGVDDRAESLAEFLKVHSNFKKTAVLVETNRSQVETYGEIFFEQILRKSENFTSYMTAGKIDVFHYNRNDLYEYDSLFDSIKYSYKTVFLLGVGGQFKHTVNKYYKGSYPADKLPKFGGWMFGYAMNDELSKDHSEIINKKIFDITDLDLTRVLGIGLTGNINIFRTKFGGFHPGLRDEAFSYDAGICICESYKNMRKQVGANPSQYLLLTNTMLSFYNNLLLEPERSFDGISSQIKFTAEGLNILRKLSCAVYDSASNHWQPISDVELMEL